MSTTVPLCNDNNVQLRFLCPLDLPAVKLLCSTWFPIQYPHSWYEDITSNPKFFSLAAVYKQQIIGLIVTEIKPLFKCNKEDQGLLASHFAANTEVAYILTLGVVQQVRRNGIATLLLDTLISHLTSNPDSSNCKAIYLHVLTSNTTAIRFYERRHFRLHSFLPLYYTVHGMPENGFSYVLYINGGCPPYTLLDYLKYLCQLLSHLCHLPRQLWKSVLSRLWSGYGSVSL